MNIVPFPPLLMCGSCGCGSGGCAPCLVCKIVGGLVVLVLTLTTIAALIGVWNTHSMAAGWTFGSGDGSLALLALVLSVTLWHKKVKKMCPCTRGGACCCSDGACAPDDKGMKHHG